MKRRVILLIIIVLVDSIEFDESKPQSKKKRKMLYQDEDELVNQDRNVTLEHENMSSLDINNRVRSVDLKGFDYYTKEFYKNKSKFHSQRNNLK